MNKENKPLKLLMDDKWLQKKIESEPDDMQIGAGAIMKESPKSVTQWKHGESTIDSVDYLTRFYEEMNYFVVAQVFEFYVEYEIYDTMGTCGGKPMFREDYCVPTPVDTYQEALSSIDGTVKWDGCSDWNFLICEYIAIHGCSKEDLTNIGLILGECYDWTSELLDTWQGD